MKVLFLAKAPDATKFFRVDIPSKYLSRSGQQVLINYGEPFSKLPGSGIKEKDVEWADIIVFQRPTSEIMLKCVKQIRERLPNKVLIGDYDDDYFSVPRWNPGFASISMTKKYWVETMMSFDGVITSTDPLKEVIQKRTHKPVKTIRNAFDFEEFDSLVPTEEFELMAPTNDQKELKAAFRINMQQFNEMMQDKTVFCWAGSKYHYMDLDMIAEDLSDVAKKRDDIVFLFVGFVQGNIVKKLPVNRLFLSGGAFPIQNYYKLLKGYKIDCSMAPLYPCPFNRSKSSLKILESFALRTYPLCSEWDPYENDLLEDEDIERDENYGKLVGYEKGDWTRAIIEVADLLKDRSFTRRFQLSNDAYARMNHSPESRITEYIEFFEFMIEQKGKVG